MYFIQIEGKTPEQQDFKLLSRFFIEHIFMAFMERGRQGLSTALLDAIDNFEQLYAAQRLAKTGKPKSKKIPEDERNAIHKDCLRHLVDEFIKQGTAGIESTIMMMAGMVHLELEEANKK